MNNAVISLFLAAGILLSGVIYLQGISGCVDPDSAAEALQSIARHDWKNLSRAGLKEIWPEALNEGSPRAAENNKDRIFVDLSHQSRKNEWCECCSTFEFVSSPSDATLADQEKLHNASIFYSARNLDHILKVAKQWLSAMSTSTSEISDERSWKMQNDKIFHTFKWDSSAKGAKVEMFAHLEIYRLGSGLWTLHLFLQQAE